MGIYVFFYLIEQHTKFLLHTIVSPELKVRIRTAIETITADMLQTVWNELDYSVDVWKSQRVTYIEHLQGM